MRLLTAFYLITMLSFTQVTTAGLPAFPDLSVRMGHYNLANNDSPVEFGGTLIRNVQVGETRVINLLLRNSGLSDLLINTPAALEGPGAAHFSIIFGPDNLLEPGAEAFTIVTYTPTSPGNHQATIRFDSTDPDESPFRVNLLGEALSGPPEAAVVDIALPGAYTVKSKCKDSLGGCTATGKATALNLSTAPSLGLTWYLLRPYSDGTIDATSELIGTGFTQKIKAYKGFPAPFPQKKVKFKGFTPFPPESKFVLFIAPVEGDQDWSDNSISIELPF